MPWKYFVYTKNFQFANVTSTYTNCHLSFLLSFSYLGHEINLLVLGHRVNRWSRQSSRSRDLDRFFVRLQSQPRSTGHRIPTRHRKKHTPGNIPLKMKYSWDGYLFLIHVCLSQFSSNFCFNMRPWNIIPSSNIQKFCLSSFIVMLFLFSDRWLAGTQQCTRRLLWFTWSILRRFLQLCCPNLQWKTQGWKVRKSGIIICHG